MNNPVILDYQQKLAAEASQLPSGGVTPDSPFKGSWQAPRLDSGANTPTIPPRGSDTSERPFLGSQRPHLLGARHRRLLTESVIAGLAGNTKRTDVSPPLGRTPVQFVDNVNKLTDGRKSLLVSPPARRHSPVRSPPPHGLESPPDL